MRRSLAALLPLLVLVEAGAVRAQAPAAAAPSDPGPAAAAPPDPGPAELEAPPGAGLALGAPSPSPGDTPSVAAVPLAAAAGPAAAAPAAAAPAAAAEPDDAVRLTYANGDGVTVASADGRYELNLRTRGMLLLQLDAPGPEEVTDPETGATSLERPDPTLDLSVRRARVTLQGRVFDRNIRYRIQLALAPSELQMTSAGTPQRSPLLDWYVDFTFLREMNVRVGQFIVPFNRSRVVSSGAMQLVDRSLTSAAFNLDRDLGVTLRSPDFAGLGWLRYYLGAFANEGRDGLLGNDLGLLYVARLEVLPLGLFDDYTEGDLTRGDRPRLSIGAAYAYADESHLDRETLGRAPGNGTFDYHNAEVDLAFLYRGLSVYSEVMWREGWHRPSGACDPMTTPGCDASTTPHNGVGWYGQAGYVLPDVGVEIAARYGFTLPFARPEIGAPRSAVRAESELGVGVNYYPFGTHHLKVQLDYFHLWSDAPTVVGGAAFDRGADRVRVMFQASL